MGRKSAGRRLAKEDRIRSRGCEMGGCDIDACVRMPAVSALEHSSLAAETLGVKPGGLRA